MIHAPVADNGTLRNRMHCDPAVQHRLRPVLGDCGPGVQVLVVPVVGVQEADRPCCWR